jgi:hypothetical protein
VIFLNTRAGGVGAAVVLPEKESCVLKALRARASGLVCASETLVVAWSIVVAWEAGPLSACAAATGVCTSVADAHLPR